MAEVLPQEARLEYLTEGAANVIYRICFPATSSQVYDPFKGYLLRLHKDVEWIPSAKSLQEDETRLIAPLFPDQSLVHQRLVSVSPELLARLNKELLSEPRRKENRRGVGLAIDEPHGLLVTDMSAEPLQRQVLVEIKPKWLAQSPNAPPDAIQCRTCALRRKRMDGQPQKLAHGQDAHATGFCPLDLVSKDQQSLSHVVAYMVAQSSQTRSLEQTQQDVLRRKIRQYLSQSTLLQRLREIQVEKDANGVLAQAAVNEDFLVATTLRDCTLYLRLTYDDDEQEVEARLGDLDLKSPEPSKLEHWRKTEQVLLKDGWYQRSSTDGPLCRLERTFL